MRFLLLTAISLAALTQACRAPLSTAPSLAPRAAESIDPRLPVVPSGPVAPASGALLGLLDALVGMAEDGDRAFASAAAEAERVAAGAGPRASESWVVAQQAVSAVIAARGPTVAALGEIDSLAAREIAAKGWVGAADMAAIQRASTRVAATERRQARRIEALQARLGG